MALTLAELIAQKKAAIKGGNRQKTVKPPDGRSKWRILPGWRMTKEELAKALKGENIALADPQFYHDFGQHFIKDGMDALKAVYVCVDKTFGKPCEICAALERAIKNTSDDETVKMLQKSKASGRILVNALNIDGASPDEPVILELAPTAFAAFLSIMDDDDIGGLDVINLKGGRDVIVERSGKGLLTKYTMQPVAKQSNVNPEVMSKIVNLDEYVAQESEEQAVRALANLNAVAGLLSAPSSSSKSPSMSDLTVDDVDDAVLAGLEGAVAAAPAVPAAPPAAPADAAAAPADATSTGDAELDDLLAELG